MRDWLLESPPGAQVPANLARIALSSVGSPRFARDLLMGVRSDLLAASYCSVFWIHPDRGARVVDVAGLETVVPGTSSARSYVESKFYGHDPLFTGMAASGACAHLRLCSSSDIRVEAYRSDCYERLGVHQRCSLVFPSTDGAWLALNFYRERRDDAFSGNELDALTGCGQLLEAAVTRHVQVAEAAESPVMRMRRLFAQAGITPREKQVLVGALEGLSNKQIARQLAIEPNTVVTYRERAYRRLGIKRHVDLVRVLLGGPDGLREP